MKMHALGMMCALLLMGCSGYQLSAPGAPPIDLATPVPSGLAKVCVVRPQSRALAFTAVIHDDGHLVGATTGRSYFCYLAEPGEHRIAATAERDTAELKVRLAAGQSYYLDQYIDSGATDPGSLNQQHMHFVQGWIDEKTALDEARQCRYLALTAAPQHEILPRLGAVAPALGSCTGDPMVRTGVPPQGC